MNLKEQIATGLRNAILQGEYGPGEHLTEQALCKRFQVSRTPIREALHQLEKEGFVRITPAAGARVVKLSLKETSPWSALKENVRTLMDCIQFMVTVKAYLLDSAFLS